MCLAHSRYTTYICGANFPGQQLALHLGCDLPEALSSASPVGPQRCRLSVKVFCEGSTSVSENVPDFYQQLF